MTKNNLSVVCLNCFGIPMPVHRKERFKLIAEALYKLSPDIIALQEVFVWTDRNILIDKLKEHYDVYPEKFLPFSSGGLITFVKKHIEVNKFEFNKFRDQGNKTLISIPDGIAGKGHQVFELKINRKTVSFINCHLLCQYNRSDSLVKSYANQITELINITTKLGNKVIVSGDLNDDPNSEGITKLKKNAGLYEQLSTEDFTVDLSNLNRGKIMNIFSNGKSYRTDYTFATKEIKIVSQSIIFNLPIVVNGKAYNLSDHYGIFTEIEV